MNRSHIVPIVSAIVEPTLLSIILAISQGKTILALGCETQERISGAISGCKSISTEDVSEIDRQRYRACIEKQLEVSIAAYKQTKPNYYTTWQWQEEQTTVNTGSQQNPIQLQLGWIRLCDKS